MRTLVLWDVDHTLLSIGDLSGQIYAEVFEDVTGRPMQQLADMTGRTDRAIITATLRLHGIEPTEDLVVRFATALGRAFDARRADLAARGKELPGARAALAALTRQPVIQSLLTGNMEPIARCKLAAFCLGEFVDFSVGAYGLDDAERPPLVRLARKRAEAKYEQPFDEYSTVLIGDTPLDVTAGHEGGARVVAVATGASDSDELRSAGAEIVLADLTDTGAVVRAVLRATQR
ncbi:HAD family hydrolase [Actinomadura harenae]|uniref:HAD family hydrolase n=1 Tax=Actinomadura harenae TaxID=2483351 RepID=UPI0018F79D3B|nr:haloacid dehalogenase-like hydrolase [Actinomadura harenae]